MSLDPRHLKIKNIRLTYDDDRVVYVSFVPYYNTQARCAEQAFTGNYVFSCYYFFGEDQKRWPDSFSLPSIFRRRDIRMSVIEFKLSLVNEGLQYMEIMMDKQYVSVNNYIDKNREKIVCRSLFMDGFVVPEAPMFTQLDYVDNTKALEYMYSLRRLFWQGALDEPEFTMYCNFFGLKTKRERPSKLSDHCVRLILKFDYAQYLKFIKIKTTGKGMVLRKK